MACVTVTSLVRTLELEFLQPQPRPVVLKNELLSGNKELIESLCKKLEFLMVQFDEKRMDGDEEIKHLESKLRDVASIVEDEIEMGVANLYVEDGQNNLQPPRLKLRLILQQAIEDIDYIKEEMAKLKNKYEHVIVLQDEVMMMGASSQLDSHSEDIMVGKDNEFETVKEMLIKHQSKERKLVLIKGMGGIGKTTLARRVYEDLSVASHFDKRAWVVASQLHNKRKMLVDLNSILQLKSADSCGQLVEIYKTELLQEKLYQFLKGQRYLIVIDDVWSEGAWKDVQVCFPDDNNGSRIMLTTRLEHVVADHTTSCNDFSHQVQFLNQSESWSLFCEKALLKGRSNYALFEMIARPVVEKCGGLPLAINVAAGLFSKLNTLYEWRNIVRALHPSARSTIVETCSRILSLSYNHLPHNLKACFLYLGVFPQDEEIYANNLARLWVAEGLVKTSEDESFEVVAEKHIQELVARNLILVTKQSSNGRKIKTFKIHDVLHAFCVKEAEKENFLHVVSGDSSNFPRKGFRWLSIESSKFDLNTLYSSLQSCRSFFYFPNSVRGKVPSLNLQIFSLLRVMYIPDLQGIPGPVVDHVHLRYLSSSLSGLIFSLPSRVWNLQTLRIRRTCVAGRLRFPQLWYIRGHSALRIDHPKFVHQNLQSISGLIPSDCTKQLFTNTPFLKKVFINGVRGSINTDCLLNLAYLQQLERLKILSDGSVFLPPIKNQIVLLKTLKKLTLSRAGYLWKDINVLSMLPVLEVLKLEDGACISRNWELTEEVKLCQLLFLKIDKTDLEHWNASAGNFPKLERLLLSRCHFLKEIPSNFAEISTLKSIELRRCHRSAVISAKQIQEDQHDYGNTNMVVIEK